MAALDFRELMIKAEGVVTRARTPTGALSIASPRGVSLTRLNKTKGPVPFRPTQRDYKRQEKLVSVDSLSKITFEDGFFKDEADLNGFCDGSCGARRSAKQERLNLNFVRSLISLRSLLADCRRLFLY
jgi:hypothetical protein